MTPLHVHSASSVSLGQGFKPNTTFPAETKTPRTTAGWNNADELSPLKKEAAYNQKANLHEHDLTQAHSSFISPIRNDPVIDRPSAEEPYSPATDPWFECDTTGHLFTTFGDAYVLHVEPHDDTFRCYIALSGDMPVFARFTAADPRDVLALAVSLENAVRMENGDPPCDAPFSGFMVFARLIHNPFTDPERGQWLFSGRQELRHPREEYGAAYDGWLDALA